MEEYELDEVSAAEMAAFKKEQEEKEFLEKELAVRTTVIERLKEIKDREGTTAAKREKFDHEIADVERGVMDGVVTKRILRYMRSEENKVKKANSYRTIDSIIIDYNFYQSASTTAEWYYQTDVVDEFGVRQWISIKKDALVNSFPGLNVHVRMGQGEEDYDGFKDFTRKLVDQSRTFTRVIKSFTNQDGALNTMNTEFCKAAEDGRTDYHWMFDAIMESNSGGEPGSIEFETFQHTFYAKWLNPNNPYLPNMISRDIQGRAGKSLLAAKFARRLFNGTIADNLNIDQVIGKFNISIAGKAFVLINESNRDNANNERTKALFGSPQINIEEKFKNPITADNTALYWVVTNRLDGGISVNGTKSDERYSFFFVKKTIHQTVQEYMLKYENAQLSIEDCKVWIESNADDSGQNILFNEEQVGRWLNAMKARYGNNSVVMPLHGDEYEAMRERQRGGWLDIVEQVLEDPDFEYIRWQVLIDLVNHYCKKEMIPGKRRFTEEVLRLIKDRKWLIEDIKRGGIKTGTTRRQSPMLRKIGLGDVQAADEAKYGEEVGDVPRWQWNWKP